MNIYTQFAQTSPSNASAPQTQRHQAAGILSGAPLVAEAPLPRELQEVLAQLRSC